MGPTVCYRVHRWAEEACDVLGLYVHQSSNSGCLQRGKGVVGWGGSEISHHKPN